MTKKILILLISVLLLSSCGSVKLSDGENAIVTFKDEEGISAQELYEVLKTNYGASHLIAMIDTFLLEKEFDSTTDEKKYVSDVVSTVKSNAESYEMEYLDYIKNYYGTQTEADFEDYIVLNYRRNLWALEYAKEQVTDKQIEDYYEDYAIGDIEARHILITANTTDDMTTDEKEAAEETAYNKAKEIIEKLNDGEDFKDLAKEYSKDQSNASDGGYLGFFNRGDMDEDFEAAAIKLEVGKYSTTPVKSAYGYHIIYKISQKDKPSLEDAKEDIIQTIAEEALTSDTTLYSTALLALREKYEMNIKDSELKSGYNVILSGE